MSEGLNVAVLTVSDTRTHETDTSGQFLEESLLASGHRLADRAIVIDDIYQNRARPCRQSIMKAAHESDKYRQ